MTPPRAVVGRGEEADLLAMVDDGLGDRRADLYEPRERRLVEARRDGELLSTSRRPRSTRLRRRRASSSARVRAGRRRLQRLALRVVDARATLSTPRALTKRTFDPGV